jgi:TonB family protein
MSRRKLWFIGASITGHIALGIGVFASGIWHIDRLDRDRSAVADITVLLLPQEAPSGGMALPKPEIAVKERPKKVVEVTVQLPDKKLPEAKETTTGSTEIGDGKTIGPGKGLGDPNSKGTCETPPCGQDPVKQDPPKKDPPPDDKTTTIPPNDLSLMRTSGNTQVLPSELTKNAMLRDAHMRSQGVVLVCVSETGSITSVKLIGSTKYPEYDARLVDAVHGWTYKPYAARGRALKVCGTVTFQYSLK